MSSEKSESLGQTFVEFDSQNGEEKLKIIDDVFSF